MAQSPDTAPSFVSEVVHGSSAVYYVDRPLMLTQYHPIPALCPTWPHHRPHRASPLLTTWQQRAGLLATLGRPRQCLDQAWAGHLLAEVTVSEVSLSASHRIASSLTTLDRALLGGLRARELSLTLLRLLWWWCSGWLSRPWPRRSRQWIVDRFPLAGSSRMGCLLGHRRAPFGITSLTGS